MPADPTDAPEVEMLAPGTKVEVRNAFEQSWSRGFLVASQEPGGYLIARRSDGAVLPAVFGPDDVRAEHHRSMWWM